MAKKNLNDLVLDRMIRLQSNVANTIQAALKGTTPFGKREIPPEDLIYAKQNAGIEDWSELADTYGANEVQKLIFDIMKMEKRRRDTGTLPEVSQKPLTQTTTIKEGFRGGVV